MLPENSTVLPAEAWQPKRSRGVKAPIYIIKKRKVLEDNRNKFVTFAAGALSGLVADAATHPIDTIRTRLWVQGADGSNQSRGYRYEGLLNGFLTMIRKEGVASLYKGFGSVALLTPLAHGLYFGSYEWAKRHLVRLDGHRWGMSESTAYMTAGRGNK